MNDQQEARRALREVVLRCRQCGQHSVMLKAGQECSAHKGFQGWDIGHVAREAAAALSSRSQQWRCFHCEEVFTDESEAREHFGADETKNAACRMGAVDVRRVRELEADVDLWQGRALSAEQEAEGLAGCHAETMRLTNGHGVFMTLDYLEGEKLVLQQRVQELESALALSSPSVSGGWQGIETAPKDGTTVLGYTPHDSVVCGDVFFSQRYEQWERLGVEHVNPTHWMPLPPPPVSVWREEEEKKG